MENQAVTTADFLEAFGIQPQPAENPPAVPAATDPAPADPPASDPASTGDESDPTPAANPGSDPAVDPSKDAPPPQQATQNDQQAHAFAQLRAENSKFKTLMNDMADLLQVNKDGDLSEAIKAKVIEANAKKTGVPIEVLQKLDYLTQRDQEFTKEQMRQAAIFGFQKVKDQFKLTDQDLNGFAQDLYKAGVNPFEQQIDLLGEYQKRNFDRLIAAAVERGRQEEAQRAAKATEQGSTPVPQSGKQQSGQSKINTIKDLDSYFNNINM